MFSRRFPEMILWLLVLLLRGGTALGATGPLEFEEGNRLYEQGKFTEAIARYDTLVKRGQTSSALFFNRGNAFFKNGEIGRAIHDFRRAEALAARDPDIQANLRFARDRVSGGSSIQPPPWQRLVSYFTLNELAGASAVFFWIVLLLLVVTRLRPALRPVLRAYISTSTVLLIVCLGLLGGGSMAAREPIAIATQNQLAVHLGPLRESQTAFTVPDGTELRIENRREGWLQVSDRSSRTGWVESGQVLTLP